MGTKKLLLRVSAIIALLLGPGCQSSMKVTVHRIEPAGEIRKEYAQTRTDLEKVSATVSALMNLQSSLKSLEDAWTRDELINNAIPLPESLNADISRGLALVNELPKLDTTMASAKSAAYFVTVQSTVNQADERIDGLRDVNANIAAQFRDGERQDAEEVARTRESTKSIASNFSERALGVATSSLRTSKPGYGGFVRTGVTRISAGDPNYKLVLEGKPQGEPITETIANVSGDSTVIFVQENPVQMRVYTVDLNAEELVRNISQISSKAVNAALKFSAPLPESAP